MKFFKPANERSELEGVTGFDPAGWGKYIGAMSAAKKLNPISVEDYLAGELISPIKHEYLGGVVYAMAGARNVHNLIATNTLVALGTRLRGKRCRPYNSDTKIRVRLPSHVRFYYPDVSPIRKPTRFRTNPRSSLKSCPAKPAESRRAKRRTLT